MITFCTKVSFSRGRRNEQDNKTDNTLLLHFDDDDDEMIWHEYMCKYLTDRGLWAKEALAVITVYLTGSGQAMAERVNDHTEGYPLVLLAAVNMGLNSAAKEWIDKNCPDHFARGCFE